MAQEFICCLFLRKVYHSHRPPSLCCSCLRVHARALFSHSFLNQSPSILDNPAALSSDISKCSTCRLLFSSSLRRQCNASCRCCALQSPAEGRPRAAPWADEAPPRSAHPPTGVRGGLCAGVETKTTSSEAPCWWRRGDPVLGGWRALHQITGNERLGSVFATAHASTLLHLYLARPRRSYRGATSALCQPTAPTGWNQPPDVAYMRTYKAHDDRGQADAGTPAAAHHLRHWADHPPNANSGPERSCCCGYGCGSQGPSGLDAVEGCGCGAHLGCRRCIAR